MAVCPWCQHQELTAERERKSLKEKVPGKSSRSRSGCMFAKESYKKSFSNHAIFFYKALDWVMMVLCTGQRRLHLKLAPKFKFQAKPIQFTWAKSPAQWFEFFKLFTVPHLLKEAGKRQSLLGKGLLNESLSNFMHFLKKSFKIKWRTTLKRFPT